MAVVYLARDDELERPVAIKVLAGHLADEPVFRDRFIREARLAAGLSHPNVVQIYDAGEDDGHPYIVMEYVDGPSAADMLRERGVHVLGEALTGDAATVRPGATPLVTDGPFAETKEAVGGFYVIDCASRDEAVELAGRVPRSPGVAVEVLGIAEM